MQVTLVFVEEAGTGHRRAALLDVFGDDKQYRALQRISTEVECPSTDGARLLARRREPPVNQLSPVQLAQLTGSDDADRAVVGSSGLSKLYVQWDGSRSCVVVLGEPEWD